MFDPRLEIEKRVAFIKNILTAAGASGLVYGNSGGKDSALVGILCKMACENTIGIIMPCSSKRNYSEDAADAMIVAEQFEIETRTLDLTVTRSGLVNKLGEIVNLTDNAVFNLAPRLRMTALYAVASAEGRLVAGTGNRSEGYMGYFTKWGDGAYDLNPISDLTVTEIYDLLRFLNAPESIISKAPSAGLFEGQSDESEMGISYKNIDNFLLNGSVSEADRAIIERYHNASEHKRKGPAVYGGTEC